MPQYVFKRRTNCIEYKRVYNFLRKRERERAEYYFKHSHVYISITLIGVVANVGDFLFKLYYFFSCVFLLHTHTHTHQHTRIHLINLGSKSK